jgi:hypothetical protein
MRRANRFAIDPVPMWMLATLSAAVLIALLIIPPGVINRLPAVCPFKRYWGMECYGCGMTRALSAFLHGDIRMALAYNRAILLTLPLLALAALLPVTLLPATLLSTTMTRRS